MDLGEKVSINAIVDEMHDETCVFCQATDPPENIGMISSMTRMATPRQTQAMPCRLTSLKMMPVS